MKLPTGEREAFLAQPHYSIVSVNTDSSRGPLAVPLWYHYVPGGDIWLLVGDKTIKTEAIKAAGRFTLTVQRMKPTRRYVSVEGPVSRIDAATDEDLQTLVYRYLEGIEAENHLAWLRNHFANSAPGANLRISMRPENWLGVDRGAFATE